MPSAAHVRRITFQHKNRLPYPVVIAAIITIIIIAIIYASAAAAKRAGSQSGEIKKVAGGKERRVALCDACVLFFFPHFTTLTVRHVEIYRLVWHVMTLARGTGGTKKKAKCN